MRLPPAPAAEGQPASRAAPRWDLRSRCGGRVEARRLGDFTISARRSRTVGRVLRAERVITVATFLVWVTLLTLYCIYVRAIIGEGSICILNERPSFFHPSLAILTHCASTLLFAHRQLYSARIKYCKQTDRLITRRQRSVRRQPFFQSFPPSHSHSQNNTQKHLPPSNTRTSLISYTPHPFVQSKDGPLIDPPSRLPIPKQLIHIVPLERLELFPANQTQQIRLLLQPSHAQALIPKRL